VEAEKRIGNFRVNRKVEWGRSVSEGPPEIPPTPGSGLTRGAPFTVLNRLLTTIV